jgi:hypothetical protein
MIEENFFSVDFFLPLFKNSSHYKKVGFPAQTPPF